MWVLGTVALVAAAGAFGRQIGYSLAADVAIACRLAADGIIHLAARRVPSAHRVRYRQEWLAELDELRLSTEHDPTVALIVFAVRVLVRARRTGKVWANRFVSAGQNPEVRSRRRRNPLRYAYQSIRLVVTGTNPVVATLSVVGAAVMFGRVGFLVSAFLVAADILWHLWLGSRFVKYLP